MAFKFNPFTSNFDIVNDATGVYDILSISSSTSVVNGKTYLVDTGTAVTITLPAPVANAFVVIKDATGESNTNNITVNPNAAETIDEASSFIIDSDFAAKIFVSDGTNWYVL